MNPSSSGIWNNPPPPGTEEDAFDGEELSNSSSKLEGSVGSRPIDRIDPYLKNPEYIEYEKKLTSSRHRSRSRSHERRRKRRSRSRTRDHHSRRSRSKSRRRRRHYSSSRSRSRSRSYSRSRHRRGSRDRRHKKSPSSRHSRSRSRSHSRSRKSHKKSRRSHSRNRSRSRHRSRSDEHKPDIDTTEVDMKIDEEDEEEETEPVKENAFKNDGSFLEMFKKMQEQQKEIKTQEEMKKPQPLFGKRRGGKVLKTGLVQKTRALTEDEVAAGQDAWSVYMKEVRRYKEACCDDDSKTRPLVK